MKTIYAFYMSWRYWFSIGYTYSCAWASLTLGHDDYSWYLDTRFSYNHLEGSWCPSLGLNMHRDFKHMTPWQLRHARRKLIYQFFKERG